MNGPSRKKTYEELYLRAIKVAQIKGYSQDAYDFAGWITERWLSGKAQHQALEYSLIDFLRQEHGGTGARRGGDAILRMHRAPQIEVPGSDAGSVEEDLERMWASSSHAPHGDRGLAGSESDYLDPTRYLGGSALLVWSWAAQGNISFKEMGAWLGISESRVSQLLTRAKSEILRVEGVRKMNERIEMGESSFDIEWIVL